MLDVQDLVLHVTTGGRTIEAVNGVSLKVLPGECVGIVGESGSGKSLLTRTIARLLPSLDIAELSGSVTFDGTKLTGLSEAEMQSFRRQGHFSMIFQDPLGHLNPTMRIGRQVDEAFAPDLPRPERDARRRKLFVSVGLPTDAGVESRYPHELSGGMRQRVLIALALANDPKLLIADEPTTALDVTVQMQVLQTLEALHRERDMALLIITHDLGVIAEICDRVYVMYRGEFVEATDVYSLFAAPKHPYTQSLVGGVVPDNAGS